MTAIDTSSVASQVPSGKAGLYSNMAPNCFILGAQKCGSSWVADVLGQHPDVFMAGTEIHFFDKPQNLKKGMNWYLSHFESVRNKRIVAEKTPEYLWANGIGGEGHNPNVHRDLVNAFPDARYVIVLRDPVDRARSALVHMVRTSRLPLKYPIDRLLQDSMREQLQPWGILEKGLYARQLEAWFSLVPRERFLILIFEQDVKRNPDQALQKVCRHLEIDDSFVFQSLSEGRNVGPETYRALARVTCRNPISRRISEFVYPDRKIKLSEETEQTLADYFRSENQKLFEVLNFDIPEWK